MSHKPPLISRTGKTNELDVSHWVNYNVHPPPTADERVDKTEELHVRFADEVADKVSTVSTGSSSTDSPVALDGGYAWYIVFISFMIHFICDGISFSFGILYPELQRYFKLSRVAAGLIGSVFLAIPLVLSPLSGVLTDVFDCKAITVTGAAISFMGMIGAVFCSDPYVFAFFFSFIGGLGMCFCYNTAIVMVTYYFDGRRAFATGIAVTGTGAGTSVMAFILEKCIQTQYGLRAAVALCAVFFGLLSVLGCTMRDVEWKSDSTESKKRRFDRQARKLLQTKKLYEGTAIKDPTFLAPPRRAFSLPIIRSEDFVSARFEQAVSSESLLGVVVAQENVPRSVSVSTFRRVRDQTPGQPEFTMLAPPDFDRLSHLDLELQCGKKSPSGTLINNHRRRLTSKTSQSIDALDLAGEITPEYSSSSSSSSSSDTSGSELSNHGDSSSSEISDTHGEERKDKEMFIKEQSAPEPAALEAAVPVAPVKTTIMFPRSSLKTPAAKSALAYSRVPAYNAYRYRYLPRNINNMELWRKTTHGGSAPTLYIKQKKKRLSRLQFAKQMAMVQESCSSWGETLGNVFFLAFLLSACMLYLLYDIPYVNFPEYLTEELNWDQSSASFVVSLIGVPNIFGMLLFGWIADEPFAENHLFLIYGLAICLSGVCVFAMSILTSPFSIWAASMLFGFFIAANYALASVLCVYIVGLADFQAGYSLLSFLTGIANAFGPPSVGLIRDSLGSYNLALKAGSIGIFLSGVLVILLYIKVWKMNFKWRPEDFEDDESDEEEDNVDEEKKKFLERNGSTQRLNGKH